MTIKPISTTSRDEAAARIPVSPGTARYYESEFQDQQRRESAS